jgi:hypothetical protein
MVLTARDLDLFIGRYYHILLKHNCFTDSALVVFSTYSASIYSRNPILQTKKEIVFDPELGEFIVKNFEVRFSFIHLDPLEPNDLVFL